MRPKAKAAKEKINWTLSKLILLYTKGHYQESDDTIQNGRKHLQSMLLSRFSHVRLYATPEMTAHQAPPCLGFSRQEHWSGLPFPSPMHESEKGKWSRSVSVWLFATYQVAIYSSAACQAPPSMGFSRQENWSGVPLPSLSVHCSTI